MEGEGMKRKGKKGGMKGMKRKGNEKEGEGM